MIEKYGDMVMEELVEQEDVLRLEKEKGARWAMCSRNIRFSCGEKPGKMAKCN